MSPPETVVQRSEAGSTFYGAFAASMSLHIAALLICTWWLMETEPVAFLPEISAHLPTSQPLPLESPPSLAPTDAVRFASEGGTPSRTAVFFTPRPLQPADIAAPAMPLPVIDALSETALQNGLAETVEPGPAGRKNGGEGTGEGTGRGTGDGSAEAGAFFGLQVRAQSVVFVVDASGSMNLPHHSQWKTRFRRLKVEIVKSISGMEAGQRFYIIFFNSEAVRMPAGSLQPARREIKLHFLRWMAKQHARGETDPRTALQYAMSLQPDVIYFLTDGAFPKKVERELLSLRQNRVAIHTFAFGDRKAETVMKQIAAANGGRYHFVP